MNPNVLRTIATLLFSSSFLGFAIGSVQANTVNISGATPGFPGYGTSVSKHNVINSGTSGVTGADGSTFKGSVAGNPAVVTTDLPLYNVDWYFVRSESGFVNTLIAPGINPLGTLPNSPVVGRFNEHDQNNNCSSSCPPHGPNPGPLFLGTSFAQTSSILNFTLTEPVVGAVE